MPPVAKTRIPARCAAIMVAATVVPAHPGGTQYARQVLA